MYLLISEVINMLVDLKNKQDTSPKWLMYDTFYGAKPGLTEFKKRLGFKPYRVKWTWQSE